MGNGSSKTKVTPQQPADVNRFDEKYFMGKVLGAGAFGEVMECFSVATEEQHAVKVVKKELLGEDDRKNLQMEVSILAELQCDHIIQLHDLIDDSKYMYIVTDLVKGGELFDRITRKEKYNEKDARGLVKILLTAAEYMHRNGVVHRDLKPENLLLVSQDDDMEIKICDFGMARRVSDLKAKEVACGTPGYVAPEVLLGKPYGCEVDIWSIGVITYILLCGYPPFYDDDTQKLFKRIKMAKFAFHEQFWREKSDMSKDLINCMICKDQKKRWTAAKLLEHPWMKLEDSALAENSLEGSQITMRKFNARRRFKAAAHTIIMTNRIRALTGAILRQNDIESNDYRKGVDAVIKEDSRAADSIEIDTDICTETGMAMDLKNLVNSGKA